MPIITEPLRIKFRILVVDDHPIVRHGLRELVAGAPDLEICGEAEDVADAVRQLETARPDVVIVDLSLRSGHGLDLIQKIHSRNDRVKILVSTMHDESRYAERALRAGATGYINKQEPPERIIDALRHVLRGEIYLSQRAASRLFCRLQGSQSLERDPVENLTNRELEVFEMIGQGLSTKQIAGRLDRSPKTVEAHRENIKTKLNLQNGSQLSRYATEWLLRSRTTGGP